MSTEDANPPAADGDADVGGRTDGFSVESLWRACERLVPPGGPDPLIGRTLGNTRLVRMLAEGGMGRVYEAEQENPQRAVAVKVMRPGLLSPESIRRFVRETRLLGGLRHPWICQVFAAGTFDFAGAELPYFVMELIPDAKPLTDYVRDEKLPVPRILDLFRQVCDAVGHAHLQGIVHRDLKPSNVLVDGHGHPKLIDFGVARGDDGGGLVSAVTDAGRILGTLQYASPEQAAGQPQEVDPRTDVYSLGVMLYELLAGRLPYDVRRASLLESVRIIHGERPPPLRKFNGAVPRRIAAIVDSCLEKRKERRFQDAAALSSAIADRRAWPPHGRPAGRRSAVPLGAVALALLLSTGFVAAVASRRRDRGAEASAVAGGGGVAVSGVAVDRGSDFAKPIEGDRRRGDVFQPRENRSPAAAASGLSSDAAAADGGSAASPAVAAGSTLVNSVGIELRRLVGGTFVMGDELGEPDETPHVVTISGDYWLGVHEVTCSQWRSVMGGDPTDEADGDMPRIRVSWVEAAEFCRALSDLPEERAAGRSYRLPTEAEWEHACRAGTTTRFSFGGDPARLKRYAWFGDNSGRELLDAVSLWRTDTADYARRLEENGCGPHPVCRLEANPWGLFDMHGNVFEWCSDWYGEYPATVATDPTGPATGTLKVCRGGSWFNAVHDVRSSRRYANAPTDSVATWLGFRVAMTVAPQTAADATGVATSSAAAPSDDTATAEPPAQPQD